jgi:hypothetical protein
MEETHENNIEIKRDENLTKELRIKERRTARGVFLIMVSILLMVISIYLGGMDVPFVFKFVVTFFIISFWLFFQGLAAFMSREIIVDIHHVEFKTFLYSKWYIPEITGFSTSRRDDYLPWIENLYLFLHRFPLLLLHVVDDLLQLYPARITIIKGSNVLTISENHFSRKNLESICHFISENIDITRFEIRDNLGWFDLKSHEQPKEELLFKS